MGKFLIWWFKATLRLSNLERARQDSALLDWLPSRPVNLLLRLGQDLGASISVWPSEFLTREPYIQIGRRGDHWYVINEARKQIRPCDDLRQALALAATQTAPRPDPGQPKENRHAIPPQVHRS